MTNESLVFDYVCSQEHELNEEDIKNRFPKMDISEIMRILTKLTSNGTLDKGSSWTKDGHYVKKYF